MMYGVPFQRCNRKAGMMMGTRADGIICDSCPRNSFNYAEWCRGRAFVYIHGRYSHFRDNTILRNLYIPTNQNIKMEQKSSVWRI